MPTIQLERETTPGGPPAVDPNEDWELDVTVIEGGVNADHLIRLTDDGCGKTCQSACPASCPA